MLPTIMVPSNLLLDFDGKTYASNTKTKKKKFELQLKEGRTKEETFMVQKEQDLMVLGDGQQPALDHQLSLDPFQFLSVTDNHYHRQMNCRFGLGIPDAAGSPGLLDSLKRKGLIQERKITLYIVKDYEFILIKRPFSLTHSFVSFGNFNTKELLKGNEIIHYKSTSKNQWTIDLYGIEFLQKYHDFSGSQNKSESNNEDVDLVINSGLNPSKKLVNKSKTNNNMDPKSNIIKATIDPSSPFIALPNHMFKEIVKTWKAQFPKQY